MHDIETPRLLLRQFQKDDADIYAQWLSDERIMQTIGDGKTRTYEQAWNNLAWICGHWTLRGFGLWAVEEKTTHQLIGRIGLFYPAGWPGVEVSWLLNPSHWGQGLATEGARAAIDFGFRQLNLPQIISLIRPDNSRSIAVAHRLGMRSIQQTKLGDVTVDKYVVDAT